MILLIQMINFIVADVLITSILTSGIISVVVFFLLHYVHDKSSKKRVDGITEKIKKQRIFFVDEMEELKKQLVKITELLEGKTKNKT